MRGMVINMEEAKLQTLVQIKAFLEDTTEVAFRIPKAERNQFVNLPESVPSITRGFGVVQHPVLDGCQIAECIMG
jgi:hypothetical protein